jgi:pilus assembly protein CpaF
MKTTVVIEEEGRAVRTEQLLGFGPFAIGRQPDSEVFLDSGLVSRRHALVEVGESSLRVTDLSTNGTLVGDDLVKQQDVDVPFDTPLHIGQFQIRFVPQMGPTSSLAPAPDAHLRSLDVTPQRPNAQSKGPSRGRARPATDVDAVAGLRREIHRQLLAHLDLGQMDAAKLDDPSFRPRVLTGLKRIVQGMEARIPTLVDRDALIGEMADEALGLGPLEQLLGDPAVTEIMVVDEKTIYVEKNGRISKTDMRFTDDARVRAVIERIVTPLGRRIDESSPIVDARLKDGSRVNAIIKPLALRGSCITIRKFSKTPMTAARLVSLGTMTEAMGRFLARSVIVKKNILISGGTGSGKTTLLNVLSAAIPEAERIVTIEDAAELQLNQPHVVALETKPPNMEGKGQFTIRDLVKNALRMRPDRIVVGECRGGETLDMLQAMNTGHEGSLTTTHANSPREAVARLETMALMAGVELPQKVIREQLGNSINLIVQQSRFPDGSRKIVEIAEVVGMDEHGDVELHPVFRFRRRGTGGSAEVLGEFVQTGYLPTFVNEFVLSKLVPPGEPCL